ncbi:hypothetical protein F4818DRAFT_441916 [Hypoxylon cercidicola]|nr:hypothetical protein F4818DRAFT_441916 [Hypoxylon cercidicola]
MNRMFTEAIARAWRYAEQNGQPEPEPAPAPLRTPQGPQRRLRHIPPRRRPREQNVLWPRPQAREQPAPQGVEQAMLWPRPQPAPKPAQQPIEHAVWPFPQRPVEPVGYPAMSQAIYPAQAYPAQAYPAQGYSAEDQIMFGPGYMITIWPPVEPEAPPPPPAAGMSFITVVWMFFTRWLWMLIAAYVKAFADLLLVQPVLWLADAVPEVAREVWRFVRTPRAALITYQGVVDFARDLRDGARCVAAAAFRTAARDARGGVSFLLGVWALLVPAASWMLWLYFMFHREPRELDLGPPEKPLSWGEEYDVNQFFRDATLWSKPRWRHTADGGMIRLPDWSMM